MRRKIFVTVFVLILGTRTFSQGLTAEYFNDIQLKKSVLKRVEPKAELYSYRASPAVGVNSENFSIRWTGEIFIPETGTYIFHITSDDGVRLWIDGKLIIDEWREQDISRFKHKLELTGKTYHTLKVEYFNTIVNAVLRLSWESPADAVKFWGFEICRKEQNIPISYFKTDSVASLVANNKTKDEPRNAIAPEVRGPRTFKIKKPVKPDSVLSVIKPIVLSSIIFERSDYHLLQKSYLELDRIVSHLKKYPALKIIIMGHTDYAGDSISNLVLSQRRAEAVARYLIQKEISNARITTIGYGSSKPITQGNEEEREANRRVEIKFE